MWQASLGKCFYVMLILLCRQQHNLALNHVVSITRRLTLLQVRHRHLLLPRSLGVIAGEDDVQIEILFCGICHSDLHTVRNEWSDTMPTVYPCVPGHEIVGRVTKVGSAVSKFKPGDLAAVGCMVDSDGNCPECQSWP